jgi:chitin synthase
MKRPDIRMAWREKLALCIIIFLMNASLIFLIIGLRYIICPPLDIKSSVELEGTKWVSSHGRYYNFEPIRNFHLSIPAAAKGEQNIARYNLDAFFGVDVSRLFYKQDAFGSYCSLQRPQDPSWDYLPQDTNSIKKRQPDLAYTHRFNESNGNSIQVIGKLNNYAEGYIGWSKESLPPVI